MLFQFKPQEALVINGLHYTVAEHPAAPGVAYGQEGRAAVVYQVVDPHGTAWALKAFRPRFRVPVLVSLADRLAGFANIPGLSVCRRTVLTSRKHTELLRQYSDLTYAVLMSWIDGPTWMQVVLEQQAFTSEQSLRLARALLHLLAEMEERGLAHCDLSGPNLILPALATHASANTGSDVALVDVEQMFGPDLSKPTILPGGSAGYAHKTAPEGVWSAEADRFAGAVLLAEILGWCDERVRRSASGESYFAPEEVQHDSTRYQRMLTSLRDYWGGGVVSLFEHAWRSEALGDCPTFGEWLVALPESVPAAPAHLDAGVERPVEIRDDQTAAVRALMDMGRQFETQGNRASAAQVYRQALALASVGGLHDEIALILRDLEQRDPPVKEVNNIVERAVKEPTPLRPSFLNRIAPAIELAGMAVWAFACMGTYWELFTADVQVGRGWGLTASQYIRWGGIWWWVVFGVGWIFIGLMIARRLRPGWERRLLVEQAVVAFLVAFSLFLPQVTTPERLVGVGVWAATVGLLLWGAGAVAKSVA